MDLQDKLQDIAEDFLHEKNDEINRSRMQSEMNKAVKEMYEFYDDDPILVGLSENKMVVNVPTKLIEYIMEAHPAHCI